MKLVDQNPIFGICHLCDFKHLMRTKSTSNAILRSTVARASCNLFRLFR